MGARDLLYCSVIEKHLSKMAMDPEAKRADKDTEKEERTEDCLLINLRHGYY